MTNTRELNRIIEEKGYKLSFVAQYIGLSPYGFARKRDNKSEFTATEIDKLCTLLGIDTDGMMAIFFAKGVE